MRFITVHSSSLSQEVRDNGWNWLYEESEDYGCWCIVDTWHNTVVGYDGGEPEDQLLVRDWGWVQKALNDLVMEYEEE